MSVFPTLRYLPERFGHYGSGQYARFKARLSNHRSSSRAGTPAHPRRDEHHVAALDERHDLVLGLDGGGLACVRVGATTQSLGGLHVMGCIRGWRRPHCVSMCLRRYRHH